MSRVVSTVAAWRKLRADPALAGKTIGLVPTMGALHSGHRSLLERARSENDIVVLTVFVNPTQFDDPSDLEKYPRDLSRDIEFTRGLADYVFAPASADELYPNGYSYRVTETDLSRRWEGTHRPGHFDGVLTVVLKLLNVIQARRAYFGEKDWQQLQLVRGMVADLFVPVEIVGCPTVRDDDGLALSSRNVRLSTAGRSRAARFPAILRQASDATTAAAWLRADGFTVDYVEDHGGRRLAAIRTEGVRLIDNVQL